MLKKLPVIMLLAVVLFGACKKGSPAKPPLSATDQLNAMLLAGKGTWKIDTISITYYDKNNNILSTAGVPRTGYYIFEYGNVEEFTEYLPARDAGNYYYTYTLNIENNARYLTSEVSPGNATTSEITSLSSTAMTISYADPSPISYLLNGQIIYPDHAVQLLSLSKYQ